MGLDTVEIVMAVEVAFNINMPESGLAMARVGDLNAFVLEKLSSRNWERDPNDPGSKWSEEEVWLKLRSVIAQVLSVPEERITKETRFVEDLGAG